MTCAEVRELAAAYALGALEPVERRELEEHLSAPGPHDGCFGAIARAAEAAAELCRALPPAQPSPALWRAIEIRAGGAERRRLRAGPVAWAAVAAALLAVAWAQVERVQSRRAREELRATAGALAAQQEALALLGQPGTRALPLAPQPGTTGSAVALVNSALGRAFVVSSSLPPQPGKVYQLWVLRGEAAPRPAGFLQTGPGAAAGEVDRAVLRDAPPDALAVSLEPAGGSPSPTQILLVGRLAG